MHLTNISKATEWFEVLQTTARTQTAMMTLAPGQASGSSAEGHSDSDHVLLMLEGELAGEIGPERPTLRKGDVLLIPAGVKHRFENRGNTAAVTFNVYSPPEYPADEKG